MADSKMEITPLPPVVYSHSNAPFYMAAGCIVVFFLAMQTVKEAVYSVTDCIKSVSRDCKDQRLNKLELMEAACKQNFIQHQAPVRVLQSYPGPESYTPVGPSPEPVPAQPRQVYPEPTPAEPTFGVEPPEVPLPGPVDEEADEPAKKAPESRLTPTPL